jgi:biofilm PGA synthesis protein PgaA
MPAMAQDHSSESNRERAVTLARRGDLEQALAILDRLHRAAPDNVAVAQDYVVVLGWAGRDAEAIDIFRSLPRERAADYAISAAARSSRNLGRYDEALDLYRSGRARWPDNTEFPVGEVHTLLDADRNDDATELARQLAAEHPDDADVLTAYGRALQLQGRHADALATSNRILALQPNDPDGQRLRILSLSESGAPELALSLAQAQPDLMTAADMRRIEANATAHRIRSARGVRPPTEAERFAEMDRILAELDRQIAEWSSDPSASDAVLNARYDRILALRNRYRMQDAIDEYRRLTAEGHNPPDYVLSAVGDAHLHLRQPETAFALYRKALEEYPQDFDTRLQMFYALADVGEFEAATALIEQLNEEQPIWLPVVAGSSVLENSNRMATEQGRAAVRLFAGDLDRAEELFGHLAEQAPRNSQGYEGLGSVYLARGWPRRALTEFEQGLAVEKLNQQNEGGVWLTHGLEIGRAQSLYELGEYAAVRDDVADLTSRFPEQTQVQRLARMWEVHNMRELQIEANAGFNSGNTAQIGNQELTLNTLLFSQPFYDNFRAFAGYRVAQSEFDIGTENFHRAAAGLEYRGGDWEISGEASYNEYGSTRPGFRLAAVWKPADFWSLAGNLDTFSRETPLRALADGVTARSAELGGKYRASDVFEVELAGQVMDFSDDNFRHLSQLSATANLLSRPDYRIDGIADLSVSGNRKSDVAYFSPELDSAQTVSLMFGQTLYRHFENVYQHRLTLTGGNYWQRNFGNNLIGTAAYEHGLLWNDVIDASVGVSYGRRVYDGDPENQLAFITRLSWRF